LFLFGYWLTQNFSKICLECPEFATGASPIRSGDETADTSWAQSGNISQFEKKVMNCTAGRLHACLQSDNLSAHQPAGYYSSHPVHRYEGSGERPLVALVPPMSVRTQPGQTEFAANFGNAAANCEVTPLRAVFEVQLWNCRLTLRETVIVLRKAD
jgi:hypothetical protein